MSARWGHSSSANASCILSGVRRLVPVHDSLCMVGRVVPGVALCRSYGTVVSQGDTVGVLIDSSPATRPFTSSSNDSMAWTTCPTISRPFLHVHAIGSHRARQPGLISCAPSARKLFSLLTWNCYIPLSSHPSRCLPWEASRLSSSTSFRDF